MYETVKPFLGNRISRSNLNRMVAICNQARPRAVGGFIQTAAGTVITTQPASAGSVEAYPVSWLITNPTETENSNSYTVHVEGGLVTRSGAPWLTVAEADVQVNSGTLDSPNYIYLEISGDNGTIMPTSLASLPNPEPNIIRVVLHTVYRDGDAVIHLRANRSNDIDADVFR